ncbi:MAG: hydantoinase/oxoprolinase family protein [Desulfobacterales bacterium]|jgi:N-methylhydantoinase A/oxoprolinase/acetone carboxylase beta subunit
MILGIDIGGTHTDAVCVKDNEIVATAKVITGENLVGSIVGAVQDLNLDYSLFNRVVLSTTLSTNAIIEKKYAATGMIVSAGPGVDPKNYFLSEDFHLIEGAIDHRGREYLPIRRDQILEVAETLKKNHVEGVGVVSKFSVRNPNHEKTMHSLIMDTFNYVSMGHRMSGSLNFPRRLHTTYFNTAVMPIQERFVRSVKDALKELGITTSILFLKADGGTYSSSAADRLPVETILSGPAASMMGGVALNKNPGTTLMLDVGGTTTDIGILIDCIPVLEPQGVCVGGLKTLVRGLKMLSVGAGGDSQVHISEGRLSVGPHRYGPPVCMGGPQPTPMDALCVLGEFKTGDMNKAAHSLAPLARQMNREIPELARAIIGELVKTIKGSCDGFLHEVNSYPVYTIHEMLHPDPVKPEQVMVIGGPAKTLRPYVEEMFQMKCLVPDHFHVANALGAALARATAQITLLADTQLKKLICPELDLDMEIPAWYTINELISFGKQALTDNARYLGLSDDIETDVIEQQSFNMIKGFNTTGKNLRAKIQSRPGIISEWSKS